jgi:hypothetical protein
MAQSCGSTGAVTPRRSVSWIKMGRFVSVATMNTPRVCYDMTGPPYRGMVSIPIGAGAPMDKPGGKTP